MGCGCKRRKRKVVKALRKRGWERTARVVDAIPSPGADEEEEESGPPGVHIRGTPEQVAAIRARMEAASSKPGRTSIRGGPQNAT